jgi:hypothetical protein
MTTQRPADARNLTGVWQGIYSYPNSNPPVSFVATLIETASMLSGTTHEGEGGGTLFATLVGGRHGSVVSFVKTYDGTNPDYRRVDYEGRLSGDATEIDGRWTIPGVWSGKFLMIRARGVAETTVHHERVRA